MAITLKAAYDQAVFALIVPAKGLLFAGVHNYLTKRDYTYQIDDLSDLVVVVCVVIWIYTWYSWSTIEPL